MSLAAAMEQIALAVSGALGGPYWDAEIVSQPAVTLDDGGSIVDSGDDASIRSCSAQVDNATEAMRASEGFADGDMRILILSGSLTGEITTDHRVDILAGPYTGTSWQIGSVNRDPCALYFELRGRRLGIIEDG